MLFKGMAPRERREGKRLPTKLPLGWGVEDLDKFIRDQFPNISGSYQLARAGKSKELVPLGADVNTPAQLKPVLGRSALYILPSNLKVWNTVLLYCLLVIVAVDCGHNP